METIIEGKVTKRDNGVITINKIDCNIIKEHYEYIHIGDKVRLKLTWFKRIRVYQDM